MRFKDEKLTDENSSALLNAAEDIRFWSKKDTVYLITVKFVLQERLFTCYMAYQL